MASIDTQIREMLRTAKSVSASEVAATAGVTRQAAHRHLRRLVDGGELERTGAGRATRYSLAPGRTQRWSYRRVGLDEDRVWQEVKDSLEPIDSKARQIAHYAVTEMVNNAIDHSAAERVDVSIRPADADVTIEITDDGVGAFRHVMEKLGLNDELHALQELHKGKVTTDPKRHTGEGIFFVSKAVDRFELEASGLSLVVANRIDDIAVLERRERVGTRVELVIPRQARVELQNVFDQYASEIGFTRTRTRVKLFTMGVQFVSRSEAKRVVSGLTKFQEVILDFEGVDGVGQGFADEVFRVFARAHPEIRLTPVGMNRAVEMMVRRALATR